MSRRYKGGVISATAPTTSSSAATGVWTMQQQLQATAGSGWPIQPVVGQQAYTTAGTFSWTAPAGVTSVSVVVVAAGYKDGGFLGGGGGALSYKNNISVTPGNSYTVVVGTGGTTQTQRQSYFDAITTVSARDQITITGDGGGYGGSGGGISGDDTMNCGGGGAGGYSGAGGQGASSHSGSSGSAGNGGAGGGGGNDANWAGGGVGLFGSGTSGASTTSGAGNPGSGGSGANYGGGAGSYGTVCGTGALRIIWPGTTRQFPSTNTGDM